MGYSDRQGGKCVRQAGFISQTYSLSVMGSVSTKDESAHGMHNLDFQHRLITTGTSEIGFWIFCI